ncbi:MAG TPA: hypothetical protein VGF35_09090 [Steroidobacteraceae bacterium]
MTTLRPELTALPARIARLPLDPRGYPIPWFVGELNGVRDFRTMDATKWRRAVKERRCWICGDPLGAYLTFVVGPMCGVNRTSSEPPNHHECARWAVRNCPFLTRPQMVRREDEATEQANAENHGAGIGLPRNPGVTLLWTTRDYRLFNDGRGKPLIRLGDARELEWFAEGRAATRAEVAASVAGGVPSLMAMAEAQDQAEGAGAVKELTRMLDAYIGSYPPAPDAGTVYAERDNTENAS